MRARYLLDWNRTAHSDVATFHFDLLLQCGLICAEQEEISPCFPSYSFIYHFSLHIGMMILNKFSVKTVDVRIFAFDSNLWFVVPKVAFAGFARVQIFGSPAVHLLTVMYLPGMQILR